MGAWAVCRQGQAIRVPNGKTCLLKLMNDLTTNRLSGILRVFAIESVPDFFQYVMYPQTTGSRFSPGGIFRKLRQGKQWSEPTFRFVVRVGSPKDFNTS